MKFIKVKSTVLPYLELLITAISQLVISFYRLLNRKKLKVLIYTDSRGHEISSVFNKKNPFSSYCSYYIKKYCVDVYICPERHTTIVDFLHFYKKSKKDYGLVILHCGVVDFSRRPISQLEGIYTLKGERMIALGFTESDLAGNLKQETGFTYEGVKTASIYTPAQFNELIIPQLKCIDNLVMIGCNPVVSSWRGSYWKHRPTDINAILEYCELASKQLNGFIDLSHWGEQEIMHLTDDNIHPNQNGFSVIKEQIEKKIQTLV